MRVQAEQHSPSLSALPAVVVTQIAKHLDLREIGRLGQTCRQLHAIQQRMLVQVTDLTLAHCVAAGSSVEAGLNTLPAICLRLTGTTAARAARTLNAAPWIRRLDLRGLKDAGHADLTQLARLHPNAQVLLTPQQKIKLLDNCLRESAALEHAWSKNEKQSLEIQGSADPDKAIVARLPVNLLKPITLKACTDSMHLTSDCADGFLDDTGGATYRRWRPVPLAKLATALLERCEREASLEKPARLFLAVEAIRTYPWYVPVSPHQRLLLLAQLAYALSDGKSEDPITVHSILERIVMTMELEKTIRRSSRLEDNSERHPLEDKSRVLSPRSLLKTLDEWGVNIQLPDSHGMTASDKLRRRGHDQAAQLLDRASSRIEKARLRLEQSTRNVHRLFRAQS